MSYYHCVGKNPLVYRTIGQQLSLVANEDGDREAFVFAEEGKRITYKKLLREADRLAAGFQCLGLENCDRVGILSSNEPTWPIAMFAAARAGLIAVLLNTYDGIPEIEHCLRKVSAKALIATENIGSDKLLKIISEFDPKMKKLPSLSTIIVDSEKHFSGTLRLKDVMSLPSIIEINSIEEQQKDIDPHSGSSILFTSGFTGSPKGVLLSHYSLINFGHNINRLELINFRLCIPIICGHISSLWSTMGALCRQGTIVIPSFTIDPEKTLKVLWEEKCSFLFGMPKFMIDILAVQKKLKLDIKNKICLTGGTHCSPELFVQLQEELGMKLKIAYGMTENCGITFGFCPEDTEMQNNTVGCAFDHLEVKVIDSDGKLVPFGTPGELCTRGYSTMIGYWEDEEKTREVLGRDGWLRTGDFFILEPNGYGKIINRLSDIIKKGNEKIFPNEIENLLGTCPKIAQAYVVGVPDEALGEELCAFISLRDGFESFSPEELYEFCKGKIASSMIPRYVEIVKDFPTTPSGKVKKLELKKQFIKKESN
uniref:Medium-chain acyl-CoA ligase ACSF2, mitochondrial n=1 Tax=Lutzomyia longipalpis TaxID=7200 RepID=A0A1B0CBE4_LUTLO